MYYKMKHPLVKLGLVETEILCEADFALANDFVTLLTEKAEISRDYTKLAQETEKLLAHKETYLKERLRDLDRLDTELANAERTIKQLKGQQFDYVDMLVALGFGILLLGSYYHFGGFLK